MSLLKPLNLNIFITTIHIKSILWRGENENVCCKPSFCFHLTYISLEMSSMAFDCEHVEGPMLQSLMADLILLEKSEPAGPELKDRGSAPTCNEK